MSAASDVIKTTLARVALAHGGMISPLLVSPEQTNGTGLMNPSVFVDGDRILCNIRHVNYTLYHSENKQFQHRY